MSKVTVIIPVYGVEKYIERCARSLFEQNLADIEYLFIDDCSPDNSINILKGIILEYPNRQNQIKIHRMPCNSGQAAVREWGIRNASGDYIIHCDSDDWTDTSMYKKMYDTAIRENADCVVCDFQYAIDKNKLLNVITSCHSTDINEYREGILLQRDPWSLCNKMFKRTSYYKELKYPVGVMGEDMVICVQLLYKCKKIAYCHEPLYFYFINSSSISNVLEKEKCFNRYSQLKINTNILIDFLSKTNVNCNARFSKIIDSLKFNVAWTLINLIHIKKYRRIWKEELHSIGYCIFFNPYIGIKYRMLTILAILRIYPFQKNRAK